MVLGGGSAYTGRLVGGLSFRGCGLIDCFFCSICFA